jgi:hypothetical protein
MRTLPALRAPLPAAMLVGLLGACLLLLAGSPSPVAAKKCPNEERRIEQAALNLPDCRAYELVTPGALVQDSRAARASVGGGALSYYSTKPPPSASSGSPFYVARRAPDDWTDESATPQDKAAALTSEICAPTAFFSPDLSTNAFEAGWFEASNPGLCSRPEELVPGEPFPYRNVLLHDPADDSYQLVNVTPPGTPPGNARFQDASDDFGEIIFGEDAQLTPEAPAGYDFYVWSDGVVRLLTILPDGSPASGELVESTNHSGLVRSGFAPVSGAMSGDGRRAFFYSGGNLYMRENPDQPQSSIVGGACTEPLRACTVQVDASQGPGPGGGGVFRRATDDGSAVLFTDESRLTPDSTAETGKPDLYRFDAGSGLLTDLTVHAGEAAGVLGVSGVAEDGSYVYFVANGALAPAAQPGSCPGALGTSHCNLYVLHNGSIELVGSLSGADARVWQEGGSIGTASSLQASVSANGRYLAFVSYESLTGYDNADPITSAPDREIFLYRAASDGSAAVLRCLSCPPGPIQHPAVALTAVGNYTPSGASGVNYPSWKLNAVLDDGRVFFDTAEALLSADGNGRSDVYEYRDGELHLISPGDSAVATRFLDASPDGTDVFFETSQSLLGRDSEGASIYDARVDGGFAEPAPAPPPCEGETCRGPITPPPLPAEPGTPRLSAKPRPHCHRGHRPRRCHRHVQRRKHRHRPGGNGRAGR